MRRSFERTRSVIIGGTLASALALPASAQDGGPIYLGTPPATQMRPSAAVQTLPATTAAKPAATAAAKPISTTGTVKPKPVAAAVPAKPGAAKPQTAAAKPKPPTKPAVDPAARLAAVTGQMVPPKHEHVFEAPKPAACSNPDAIGVSRVLKVDTTDGFYVGSTYHTRLPLEPKEVVLTFDDGPMAGRTDRVLEALDHECTKATFFIVGQMAKAYPETLRKTAAAGHTIGYHTMTHPLFLNKWPVDKAQNDVRSGWQTVDQILYGQALDHPATPFFRYPGLFNNRGLNEWFNSLNMGVFSINAAGNDWLKGHLTMADGPNVMNEALKEIEAGQGGILLLHDIKDSSSSIVGPLLRELKARGYRIVHIVPKNPPPKLVAGPIQGHVPTVAETTAPLPERNIGNFDASRQLAQMSEGRTGQSAAAPLPVYERPAAARPTTVASVRVVQPAVAPKPIRPVSASVVQQLPDEEPEVTNSVPQHPVKREEGWFSGAASSFKGIGGALGMW